MAEQGEESLQPPKKTMSKSSSKGKLSKKKSKEELKDKVVDSPLKSPRSPRPDEEKDGQLTESKSRKGLFTKSKSVKATKDTPSVTERYGQFEITENVSADYQWANPKTEALIEAIARGDEDGVKMRLMESSAFEKNALSVAGPSEGHTALCYAVICGRFEVILILANNPDVDKDKKNLQSQTPLMLASERGLLDAVVALLAKGANYRTLNAEDQTAADLTTNSSVKDVFEARGKFHDDVNSLASFTATLREERLVGTIVLDKVEGIYVPKVKQQSQSDLAKKSSSRVETKEAAIERRKQELAKLTRSPSSQNATQLQQPQPALFPGPPSMYQMGMFPPTADLSQMYPTMGTPVSPRHSCAECQQSIQNSLLKMASGKFYHTNCFVCFKCKTLLGTLFYAVGPRHLCSTCYEELLEMKKAQQAQAK